MVGGGSPQERGRLMLERAPPPDGPGPTDPYVESAT